MFKVENIEEPDLMFSEDEKGQNGKAKDPRIGLVKYGPRTPEGRPHHVSMKIGLIGDYYSINEIQNLFNQMRERILPEKPKKSSEPQKWKMPFPGLSKESPLNVSMNLQKRWREVITKDEIENITNLQNHKEILEKTVDLFEKKTDVIYGKETPPDVIVICIPEQIYQKYATASAYKQRIQTDESDLHNRVKLKSIIRKVPTQIIHPNTLRGKKTQDMSDIAWNLAVGLLYKSQKGHPWKLAEFELDTCYAGISFYKERTTRLSKAAMAQVFLDSGESFILRADQVHESLGRFQNHLTEEDAKKVVNKILNQYYEVRKSLPSRLVIHKTSNFWEEEKNGILSAANGVKNVDLITIEEDHPLRLFNEKCDYPVLRGTMLTPPDRKEYYLFTNGFVSVLGAYQGYRVPAPIVIKPDEQCVTPIEEIAKEILAFTKLDWNSSHFCKKIPVTIEVSRSVGGVLAEPETKTLKEIDPHYYFYM
ncbi:MAG: hypothetical protein ABSA75_02470 [Candidatus Bathyarchaeia archaeon]